MKRTIVLVIVMFFVSSLFMGCSGLFPSPTKTIKFDLAYIYVNSVSNPSPCNPNCSLTASVNANVYDKKGNIIDSISINSGYYESKSFGLCPGWTFTIQSSYTSYCDSCHSMYIVIYEDGFQSKIVSIQENYEFKN